MGLGHLWGLHPLRKTPLLSHGLAPKWDCHSPGFYSPSLSIPVLPLFTKSPVNADLQACSLMYYPWWFSKSIALSLLGLDTPGLPQSQNRPLLARHPQDCHQGLVHRWGEAVSRVSTPGEDPAVFHRSFLQSYHPSCFLMLYIPVLSPSCLLPGS